MISAPSWTWQPACSLSTMRDVKELGVSVEVPAELSSVDVSADPFESKRDPASNRMMCMILDEPLFIVVFISYSQSILF